MSASRHLKELRLHQLPTPTAHVHGMTPITVPTSTHSLQAAPTSPPPAPSFQFRPSPPTPPHPTSSPRQSPPAPPSNSPGSDHSAPRPRSNLLQMLTWSSKNPASPSGRPHPRSTPGLKILPGSRLPQNKIQSHSFFVNIFYSNGVDLQLCSFLLHRKGIQSDTPTLSLPESLLMAYGTWPRPTVSGNSRLPPSLSLLLLHPRRPRCHFPAVSASIPAGAPDNTTPLPSTPFPRVGCAGDPRAS